MSYFSNVVIKQMPCYQCLCLPICRHKSPITLIRSCPNVKKYLNRESPGFIYLYETPAYDRLRNFLNKEYESPKNFEKRNNGKR